MRGAAPPLPHAPSNTVLYRLTVTSQHAVISLVCYEITRRVGFTTATTRKECFLLVARGRGSSSPYKGSCWCNLKGGLPWSAVQDRPERPPASAPTLRSVPLCSCPAGVRPAYSAHAHCTALRRNELHRTCQCSGWHSCFGLETSRALNTTETGHSALGLTFFSSVPADMLLRDIKLAHDRSLPYPF
jgi:hypothetical protein